MSVAKLERLTCDRCGDQDIVPEGSHEAKRARWARLVAATFADREIIGDSHAPADLCGPCADSLLTWFKQDRKD